GVIQGYVTTAEIKTSTAETWVENGQAFAIMPSGEYGFYPRIKMSDTSYSYSATILAGVVDDYYRGGMLTLAGFEDYQTMVSIYASDPGKTIYVMQRYVTASGRDWWVFLLVDKGTGDIVRAYSAADHPAYGNGDDFNKIQHPFAGYDSKTQDIVLVDNATTTELRGLVTEQKSLLTLVHDDYRVGDTEQKYVPLHSGKLIKSTGKSVPVMVDRLPAYIKVRKLVRLTSAEKQARQTRIEAAMRKSIESRAKRLSKAKSLESLSAEVDSLKSELERIKNQLSKKSKK
ncbi:MAG: hypothetical protein GX410_01045, partial [Elusimicrobia bacterium]|nr:hypothetical protein [Elusimicrobiota bacterium]